MDLRNATKQMIAHFEQITRLERKSRKDQLARSVIKKLETFTDKSAVVKKSKKSQAWKQIEKEAARLLKGKRIVRGDNFAVSRPDVLVDFRALRVDSKHYQKFAHHTLMEEIKRKYCKRENDVPVLVTKTPRQKGAYVTVPLEHYAALIDVLRDPDTPWDGLRKQLRHKKLKGQE